MATTYLTRTGTTPTTSNKYTFSCWIKRGSIGTTETLFRSYSDGSNSAQLIFDSDDTFAFQDIVGGTTVTNLKPSNLFRDTGAWMNIIVQVDYTQAAAADRAKIFINGGEVSYSATTRQSQNGASNLNTAANNAIGSNRSNSSHYFTGSMSQVNFIDGTAYPATAFGSVNATSGIWVANSSPTVTYGNNGFFLKMDTTSPGSDTSGNDNTFTAAGTPTLAQDNVSNNLVTMNPLDNFFAGGTFSNGNNTIISRNAGYSYNTSTVGVNKGKFYWECKWSATPTGSGSAVQIGIAKRQTTSTTNFLGSNLYSYAYQGDSGAVRHNDSTVITYNTYAIGDIIGIALDMDNNRLYFSKNGVFQNSSNPADGTNPISILAPDSTLLDTGFYFAGFGDGNDNLQQTGQYNFGNGFFGVTAVASSNADAAGHGLFEYAVPTGFFTINTKNLNTYG